MNNTDQSKECRFCFWAVMLTCAGFSLPSHVGMKIAIISPTWLSATIPVIAGKTRMKKKKGYSKDASASGRPAGGTGRIFGLAKQLNMKIDDIRGMAKDISGIASISQLTNHQANELIRRLGQKIKQNRNKKNMAAGPSRGKFVDYDKEIEKRFKPDPPWCITKGQREKINELMVELDWHMPALYGWIQKQNFGFEDHPGNAAQASGIITRLIAVRRADLARARP